MQHWTDLQNQFVCLCMSQSVSESVRQNELNALQTAIFDPYSPNLPPSRVPGSIVTYCLIWWKLAGKLRLISQHTQRPLTKIISEVRSSAEHETLLSIGLPPLISSHISVSHHIICSKSTKQKYAKSLTHS